MVEERNTKVRLWIWRGFALIVVIIFFVAQHILREKLEVRAVTVQHETLSSIVSTNGHVEPQENIVFYSPVTTMVRTIYVQSGEQVKPGQLLLQLDDVEARAKVATAESGVKTALANLEATEHSGTLEQRHAASADLTRAHIERDQAKHDLDALSRLAASGAAAPSEVASARQRLETDDAALKAQEQLNTQRYSAAEIERAKAAVADAQAGLAAAREVLAQTAVRTKIAGTVYAIDVHKGDYAEEGKPLVQVADLNREQIRAYFDEVDIGHLKADQPISIKWDARPGREWHGHILHAPTSVTTYGTRNVGEVVVAIDSSDGTLLPDTNVNVTATTSSEANVLSVPRQALHAENGMPFVFKVVGNGLQRTQVTTGIRTADKVAILSGLQEGDVIATGSTSGQPLQEGVPVKVIR
ncbi:efflux RND transporter periplasmic adaptor subunit [Telmatobacter bradus]|uniref:efflux RND transporter periplasmic adaptor subunit n=1 Tax=Telmatobacter bradus TaxID=474953 RepID=UPI003B43D2B2